MASATLPLPAKALRRLLLQLVLVALTVLSAHEGCQAARRLGPQASSVMSIGRSQEEADPAHAAPALTRRSSALAHSSISSAPPCPASSFSPVLAFGDSTTDTGNNPGSIASSLPYGSTFFHEATGRWSDGRLMVDFLCQALGVPLLPAHLRVQQQNTTSSSSTTAAARPRIMQNENFAVAGATALDVRTLEQLAGVNSSTPDSLDVQVGWFLADLEATSRRTSAPLDMSNALVYIGEIGGNDYNYAWSSPQPDPSSVAAMVPSVVQKVASQVEDRILSTGVKRMVVQGEFPMGCMATYMSRFASSPHDSHGCVAHVSAVSDRHNQLLSAALQDIASRHPGVDIVYLDTSAAFLQVFDHASDYGFTSTQAACFPRFMPSSFSLPASPCANPNNFISWDGLHLTDAMYGAMMGLMLKDPAFSSPSPSFLTTAAAACASN